jgi:hypothetical protein
MNKIGLLILAIVGMVAFIAALCFYHAFVLATLWTWFIVPLGVAKIGYAHAYGLSLIPSVILGTRGLNIGLKKEEDAKWSEGVSALIYPAVALLFGYIAVGFI